MMTRDPAIDAAYEARGERALRMYLDVHYRPRLSDLSDDMASLLSWPRNSACRQEIIKIARLLRGQREYESRKWRATVAAILERERLAIADEMDAAAMTRIQSSECVG